MKFIRPQHFDVVSEDIIKQYLKVVFWLSPLMWWKLYEILSEVL